MDVLPRWKGDRGHTELFDGYKTFWPGFLTLEGIFVLERC